MKNSNNEDFIINFNQIYELSIYHLLTNHITEIYEGNEQARNLIQALNISIFKFEYFNLGNLHMNQIQIYINKLKQFLIFNHKDLHIRIIEFCHFNQIYNYRGE